MLFSSDLRLLPFLQALARRLDRPHLGAQLVDEIFDVERQRRAALHGDVGVEARRLDDLQQLDGGVAAMLIYLLMAIVLVVRPEGLFPAAKR